MKKLTIFALLLVSVCAYSQIGNITTTKKNYEWISNLIYHEFSTDKYTMYIRSNNQFEDKCIEVYIGKGEEETIQSLRNLRSVFDNGVGQQFTLNGYKFNITDNYIRAIKSGSIYYSAGDFSVWKWELDYIIKNFENRIQTKIDTINIE